MTYHDVYGRKHASIYDCTDQRIWIPIDYLKNIRYDLTELDRQDRVKRIPGPEKRSGLDSVRAAIAIRLGR